MPSNYDDMPIEKLHSTLQDRFKRLSGDTMHAPADPAVIDALKAAGVSDPDKVVSELEAKGFKIESSGGMGDELKPPMEPPMKEPADDMMAPTEDELDKMPMDKARGSAAKWAFEKTKPKKEEAMKG